VRKGWGKRQWHGVDCWWGEAYGESEEKRKSGREKDLSGFGEQRFVATEFNLGKTEEHRLKN